MTTYIYTGTLVLVYGVPSISSRYERRTAVSGYGKSSNPDGTGYQVPGFPDTIAGFNGPVRFSNSFHISASQ